MIRMAATRIQFLYVLMFFTVRWGTFRAPAWIMLPLWLADQWWQAELAGTGAGVAFWAHIGGFLFGALLGVAMKWSRIEERFIRPGIEEKVSYGGDPRLDRGIELKETGEGEEALKLFAEAAAARPESLEARELAFTTALALQDDAVATVHAAPLLEICLKRGRPEQALGHYETMAPLEGLRLTPRLLFALAGAREKTGDAAAARETYRRLAAEAPEDLLALKALLREGELARRAGDRTAAAGALEQAKAHPLATAEWQARIAEMEKA